MTILYIHGFSSTGNATKAGVLREHFGDENVLSPTLPVDPELAIELLVDLIGQLVEKGDKPFLVGSSLGGYYSIYLAEKIGLKAALINPAVTAPVRMYEAVGFHTNWQTDEEFEFKESYADSMIKYYVNSPDCSRFLLLLQEDDDLLDYRQAIKQLPTAQTVIKTGGGHQYDNFADEMNTVAKFFGINEG